MKNQRSGFEYEVNGEYNYIFSICNTRILFNSKQHGNFAYKGFVQLFLTFKAYSIYTRFYYLTFVVQVIVQWNGLSEQ